MSSENKEMSVPSQLNLPSMPKVVMEEVLQNLDCRAIFCLRKVCRSLRFTIDSIEPELHLNRLSFELPLTASSLELYLNNTSDSTKDILRHSYKFKPITGCLLGWNNGKMNKYSQISMEDAESLLKNDKLIPDDLYIDLRFSIGNETEYIQKMETDVAMFSRTIESLLENRGRFLKTKRIELQVHRLSEAAALLKYIDPKSLRTISIQAENPHPREGVKCNFSELETLEQWKNADDLKIGGNFMLTIVESFASFRRITVRPVYLTIEQINSVKELFIRSPKLKHFIIESDKMNGMIGGILSSFGQYDTYRNLMMRDRGASPEKWITWLKEIPNFKEKLQIILQFGSGCTISFSKI